jgi:hypothetical protein
MVRATAVLLGLAITLPSCVQDYRRAIDKYHPDAPPGVGDGSYRPARPYSFGSLEGFVSAKDAPMSAVK